jgi:hypothetical protein
MGIRYERILAAFAPDSQIADVVKPIDRWTPVDAVM